MFSTFEAWKAAMIEKVWVAAAAWSWTRNLVRADAPDTPRLQKPCDRTGCDGTMIFDDAEMPSYATWICTRNPDHRTQHRRNDE